MKGNVFVFFLLIRKGPKYRIPKVYLMTTSEIAKIIGISRGTISRVINNNPNVKKETRQKVLQALKEYNYIPNETARSLVMKKSNRIAVIVFSEPLFFWKQVEDGVNAAHNELHSQGLTVDYFITDILKPYEQLELLKTLPQKNYDAIAIAPNNPQILLEELDNISQKNIPISIINVEIPSANQLCYIGCDYIQSGILAGEIISKTMNNQGNVAILTLADSVGAIEQRIIGFRKELSNHKNITISQVLRFNRKGDGVYEKVIKLLNDTPTLSGIYVSFGALEQTARAISDMHLESKICVVGYDLNEEINFYLQNGAITCTIYHDPYEQGYFAVKILHNYLNSKAIPKSSVLYNRLEAIFASNAKYFLEKRLNVQLY